MKEEIVKETENTIKGRKDSGEGNKGEWEDGREGEKK